MSVPLFCFKTHYKSYLNALMELTKPRPNVNPGLALSVKPGLIILYLGLCVWVESVFFLFID